MSFGPYRYCRASFLWLNPFHSPQEPQKPNLLISSSSMKSWISHDSSSQYRRKDFLKVIACTWGDICKIQRNRWGHSSSDFAYWPRCLLTKSFSDSKSSGTIFLNLIFSSSKLFVMLPFKKGNSCLISKYLDSRGCNSCSWNNLDIYSYTCSGILQTRCYQEPTRFSTRGQEVAVSILTETNKVDYVLLLAFIYRLWDYDSYRLIPITVWLSDEYSTRHGSRRSGRRSEGKVLMREHFLATPSHISPASHQHWGNPFCGSALVQLALWFHDWIIARRWAWSWFVIPICRQFLHLERSTWWQAESDACGCCSLKLVVVLWNRSGAVLWYF